MTVIIQRICSDKQRAGVSNTFAFAVLKGCGNLRRSLLAFRQLRCWLLYVTNCAFYLIRLLASLSNGNECAVPKTGCIILVFESSAAMECLVSPEKLLKAGFSVIIWNWVQTSCLNVIATCISIIVNAILLVGKTTFDTNEADYLLMKCPFLRWTNGNFSVDSQLSILFTFKWTSQEMWPCPLSASRWQPSAG